MNREIRASRSIPLFEKLLATTIVKIVEFSELPRLSVQLSSGGNELLQAPNVNVKPFSHRVKSLSRARVRLLPPLRDYAGIKADGGADETARDDVRLRLPVNRDRMEMENLCDFASSEGPMIGAKDLRDQRWI